MRPKPINKYVPVLDKLHLNLSPDLAAANTAPIDLLKIHRGNAPALFNHAGFTLEQKPPAKDRQYHLQYAVIHEDTTIGSLFLDLKAGLPEQRKCIPFHLENEALYSSGWIPALTAFLHCFALSVETYTRVDVALDTNADAVSLFYQLLDSPAHVMKLSGKLSDSVNTAGIRKAGGHRQDSILVGSAQSDKQTVIYDKTVEIATTGKYYISDFHAANGLDTTHQVQRIELRLKAGALKVYSTVYVNEDGESASKYRVQRQSPAEAAESTLTAQTRVRAIRLDYRQMQDATYLVTLFATFNMIDFRKLDSKNISRCTRFHFINFTIFKKSNTTMTPITTYQALAAQSLRNERQAIKTNVEAFKSTGKGFYYLAAAHLAETCNQGEYLTELIKHYNVRDMVSKSIAADTLESYPL